jgi:hypothetical protein
MNTNRSGEGTGDGRPVGFDERKQFAQAEGVEPLARGRDDRRRDGRHHEGEARVRALGNFSHHPRHAALRWGSSQRGGFA